MPTAPVARSASALAREFAVAGRTAALLTRHLAIGLADAGLSFPQYRVLLFLSGGPERAAALATRLAVSPPTLTSLVDGMVNKGLVERTAAPGDRRAVQHTLTPAGRQALADADAVVASRLEALAAHLPTAQQRKALDGLALWQRALDAEADSHDHEGTHS